jgi:hypothetical protein
MMAWPVKDLGDLRVLRGLAACPSITLGPRADAPAYGPAAQPLSGCVHLGLYWDRRSCARTAPRRAPDDLTLRRPLG